MNEQKENDTIVTVCVCYYNDEKYLKTCIDSILNQDYKKFQLILLNHASGDDSYKIAHSYKDDRIVHVDAPKNLGASTSYNYHYILPFVRGEYIKLFCADDVMAADCISTLLEYANQNPEKDIIFGNMQYINAKNKLIKKDFFKDHKTLNDISEINILKTYSNSVNRLPYPASLIKTETFKNIIIDNSMTICADQWLWLSAIINGAKVGLCNKIVAYYRRHKYQESYLDKEIIRRRAEYEKIPLLSLFFNMTNTDIVKQIFDDSPYIDKLDDTADIPFYIAEYFLRKKGYLFAYEKLFYMLLDEEYAKHLEEKFGFGVLELRKLYAFKPKKESLKKYIYAKQGKYLTISELAFLLFYRIIEQIFYLITFRFLR